LVPLTLLCLYLAVFSLVLPLGVNKVFVTRSVWALLPVTALLWLGFLGAIVLAKVRPMWVEAPEDRPSAGDAMLLFLPLTPIVQYLTLNVAILGLTDTLLLTGLFTLFAALIVLVVPFLLHKSGSTRPVMYLGLALAFSITNMAATANQHNWHDWVSLQILFSRFAGIALGSWLLFRLRLTPVLHLMIFAFFVANCLVVLRAREAPDSSVSPLPARNRLVALVGSRQPVTTPGIYLLIYDSYVASETMAGYGIDNRPHEEYLEETGFTLYPNTYSMAAGSLKTMSRVLNASPDYILDREGRAAVSGGGTVLQLLKGYGYETYGVFPSDFYFRGTVPSYDYSFPRPGSSAGLLIGAIFEGEFRFDIGFDDVSGDEFIQEKERFFSSPSTHPRFVYSHSTSPGHSQVSTCGPDEVQEFRRDVVEANREMRHDIQTVLDSDPNAIIVVAGDHGPRLTKNCEGTAEAYDLSEVSRLDIQDRFGAFLAIRWPSPDFEAYDEITVLQDLFPAVFAYMFKDTGLLQARPDPETIDSWMTSGAMVVDGVILGGIDDGEPLFTGGPEE
jgi:hypothetical protein